ncbi:ABC transporter ATP-binding protein [soil metagenome]
MIEFDGVSKSFGGRPALQDVSFTVADGEFCVFLGPSGAGKSTALRLVNRLIAPDAGTIRLDDADIAGLDPVALRRRLGYVIQSIGLFPHWSVAKNIGTVPRLLGWDKARIARRVDELLALVDLDPFVFRNRPPHQLSGGQQQRVGLARALAADPHILLMDEPFGALDAVTRDALQGEMVRIHAATGKTILMVTHDIDEAVRLGTRIVVLHDGAVAQNGPPEAVLATPATDFVRALVGGESAALRLLKIRRVGDWLDDGRGASGPAVSPDDSLDTALARMLGAGKEALPVVDRAGNRAGDISLADLVRRDR